MSKAPSDNQYFGTEKTMKILFKLAPPVMLAQLIQSLYNITFDMCRCSRNRCRRQYRYGTVLRSKANFQSD